MLRLICLACCVLSFASPAAATILVQDGDFYDVLDVKQDDVLITGGTVNKLKLGGISSAVIERGVIGENNDDEAIEIGTGNPITIRGGTIRRKSHFPSIPGIIYSSGGILPLTFEGTTFRIIELFSDDTSSWQIQGWLADDSFLNVYVVHLDPASTADFFSTSRPAKFLLFRETRTAMTPLM
ncbi:MAG: hypothetical protein SGJ19_12195 [Planctomycetia bacterium]|nr:hypothetical protein [Planctomycetia bacterium]